MLINAVDVIFVVLVVVFVVGFIVYGFLENIYNICNA